MTAAIELADPRGLWALALAVPIVLTHLYRRRRRRLVVAFVPLLKDTVGETRPLGWGKRMADAVRLACRLLALACLAAALAGPRPSHAAVPEKDLVLVLDADVTSRAIEAREEGGVETRFDRQVALARALALAHEGGRVGLVLAQATPSVRVAPTADRAVVLRAIDALPAGPADGRADLAAAIEVARAAARPERDLEVLAVTSRPLPRDVGRVSAVGAGSASDDQGIVDMSIAPAADGIRSSVRFRVKNFAAEPRKRKVRVALRGAATPMKEEEIEIPAGGTVDVKLDVLPPREGGVLEARLQGADLGGPDAFDRNDVAALVLPAGRRPSILVVHGGAPRPFVRAVLDALGDAVDRDHSGFVTGAEVERAAPRDVTIVDGTSVPAAAIARGAWIFLAPFPDAASTTGWPFAPGHAVKDPLVWRTDAASPLLRGVDLSTAYVARATTLVGEGVHGLAFAEGAPVVGEGTAGTVRWMAFGLDADGSDLPLRAALPILLRNAIRRMGEAPLTPLKSFYRAGEPVAPRAPWAEAKALSVATEPLTPYPKSRREREAVAKAVESGARPTATPEDPLDAAAPARPAPQGGPWLATVLAGGEPLASTAYVDLDPERDVTPARSATSPPSPAPPPVPDASARWFRWLLGVACALLLLDLVAGALARRKLAAPARRA